MFHENLGVEALGCSLGRQTLWFVSLWFLSALVDLPSSQLDATRASMGWGAVAGGDIGESSVAHCWIINPYWNGLVDAPLAGVLQST